MQELRYERPRTIDDAVMMLGRKGARALAGGTDLVPQLREGRGFGSLIVDVKHIPALVEVARLPDGGWRIGAAASIGRLARHRELLDEHGPIVDAACLIGSLQIQNRATLGGNLCNAAPSADAVPLLIALNARVEIHGAGGTRTVPAESLPTAPGRTSLGAGELLIAILLPPKPARCAARYLRFTPRREMDIAIAGSGVQIEVGGDGLISGAAIVLASVAPTPLRVERASAVLVGQKPAVGLFAKAAAVAAKEARPISDTRGSAEYRRELVSVLTRRALADCADQLGIVMS